MLMPIVSMNKMAMNESVAATCCYHEKASPTNVYWEVLNGGWIGSGYVELSNFKKWNASTAGWTKYGRDIDLAADRNITLPKLAKNLNGDWVVQLLNPINGDIWADPGDASGDWFYMDHYLRARDLGMEDAACSHNDSACNYFLSTIQYKDQQHFQASTKHNVPTSGQSWDKPHDVGQFNS